MSVPQVNGQNVVKVGHRQVVNMIRQGGNTLMVKVVMVTRHPDMEEAVHKKGEPPPRVARPPGRLSGALQTPGLPFLTAACPPPFWGDTEAGRFPRCWWRFSELRSAAVVAGGGCHGASPRAAEA